MCHKASVRLAVEVKKIFGKNLFERASLFYGSSLRILSLKAKIFWLEWNTRRVGMLLLTMKIHKFFLKYDCHSWGHTMIIMWGLLKRYSSVEGMFNGAIADPETEAGQQAKAFNSVAALRCSHCNAQTKFATLWYRRNHWGGFHSASYLPKRQSEYIKRENLCQAVLAD